MRTRKNQQGVAIVEFALLLPLLLIMSFTVIELGRALMHYNLIAKSTREAARYLSMQTPGTKMTEARNIVVYGNTSGTGSALVPGLSTSNVPDPTWQPAGADPIITTVTVQVSNYTFQPLISSAFNVTFGPINFSTITATMRSPL
jgi:Flp pilus assembly protein TadG